MTERRLYRSRSDRMIAGVCAGIADYFEVDPTLVRLLAVLGAVVSFGGVAIAYLIMAIAVSEEPESAGNQQVAGAPAAPLAAAAEQGSTVTASPAPATQGTGPAPAEPAAWVPPAAPTAPSAGIEPAAPAPRRGGSSGVVLGAIVLVLGVLLLAAQFIPGFDVWRLWPLILVAIGLAIMIRGGRR